MIVVLAAMASETAGFGRRLAGRGRTAVDGYAAWVGECGGNSVLLCRAGIGRGAESALRAVLDRYRPWLVLSAGVGGALNPEFRAGDLVLCESIRPASPASAEATPVRSDEGLLRLAQASAEGAGLRVWRGQSLTLDRVVGDPAEKGALSRSWGADVVEMESYWLGTVLAERGLPFLAARVVLDELGDRIPDLSGVVEADGSQRTYRALTYALRHPVEVPSLLRLALAGRRAAASLTRFLEAFVAACRAPQVVKPA